MSNTKWTPGPWYETKNGVGFIRGAEDKSVASVYGDDPECHPDARMHANCCLIAAAPDLYEALNLVLDGLGALTKPHELGEYIGPDAATVWAALAKARGENNG